MSQLLRPAAYEGFVATGCQLGNGLASTHRYFNSRKRHHARSRIQRPKIILPNVYHRGSDGVAVGPGGSVTYTASIEYKGQFYQATFGGQVSAVVPDAGYVISDEILNVDIKRGDTFFVRVFGNTPSGFVYFSDASGQGFARANGDGGEALAYSTTVLSDLTMGGTVTSTDGLNIFAPIGIVAQTREPSVLLVGDSVGAGLMDNVFDGSTDFGIARVVGPYFGYSNCCVNSDTMARMSANSALRVALSAYASHVLLQHGTNDLGGSLTLSQIKAAAVSSRNLFSGLTAIQVTTAPRTTSTDAWATGANQTTVASETVRTQWNDFKRRVSPDFDSVFDLADPFETDASGAMVSVLNGGRWKSPGMTIDGIHPNAAAYRMLRDQASRFLAAIGP